MHLNQNPAGLHTFGLLLWKFKYLGPIKKIWIMLINAISAYIPFSSLLYTHLALGSSVLFHWSDIPACFPNETKPAVGRHQAWSIMQSCSATMQMYQRHAHTNTHTRHMKTDTISFLALMLLWHDKSAFIFQLYAHQPASSKLANTQHWPTKASDSFIWMAVKRLFNEQRWEANKLSWRGLAAVTLDCETGQMKLASSATAGFHANNEDTGPLSGNQGQLLFYKVCEHKSTHTE